MELLELEGPSSVVGPASVVGPTSVVGPASVVGPTSVVGPASVVGPTSVVGPAAVAVEPAVEEVLGGFFGSGGLKLPCSAASTKGYSGGVVGTASPKITTGVPGAASGASGASVGSWSLLFGSLEGLQLILRSFPFTFMSVPFALLLLLFFLLRRLRLIVALHPGLVWPIFVRFISSSSITSRACHGVAQTQCASSERPGAALRAVVRTRNNEKKGFRTEFCCTATLSTSHATPKSVKTGFTIPQTKTLRGFPSQNLGSFGVFGGQPLC